MIDIQQRIEDIVAKHGELEDSGGVCECGWWTKGEAHAAHVASVITAKLGLIEDVHPNAPVSVPEYNEDGSPTMDDRMILSVHKHHIEWVTKRRWVTEWENDNE